MFSQFIVWYLFLSGTAAGAFLGAAAISLVEGNEPLLKAHVHSLNPSSFGFIVAAAGYVLSGVFLIADLGNPARILQVVANPFQSLMSEGAWLVALSAALAAITAALAVVGRLNYGIALALEIVGSILSVGVLVYAGVLLSSMRTVDFWDTPLLIALFAISGLTCGIAVISVVGFVLGGSYRREHGLGLARCASALVEVLVLVAFLSSRYMISEAGRDSCMALFTGNLAGYFWGGVIAVGLVAPMAAAWVRRMTGQRGLVLAAAGCTLIGGYLLRYCIVECVVLSPLAFGGLFE
ncbi:NrfD/PsrC family molybdoenzyme membrane anchor subunit [Parvibacter caecicola]|uniref:Formate-dependent nitrite reductase membrane component NrfD n=1 Tax=Parvibacter caecicola TaxID=747645 RepID=A0A7W5GNT9_9ACTN|nr:NrfD/PsrC family molybdoenzyme membrane anchor subunit [Parvibacter caecicola]MBB3170417.1 formate-dependent nitrite reductase membrane component NrfD [Parvibacter caecicola]MCR2041618.1 polysulfide reductase NrfD [Parvibacter caecicola]